MNGYSNKIIQEDLHMIYEEDLDWNSFSNKSILITGATGLIASYLTFFFVYLKRKGNILIDITVLCRTKEKAISLFGDLLSSGDIRIIYQDICEPLPSYHYDYIFHLAGNASPHYIKNDPVGILKANVLGTINVLESAKASNAKVFFASTREVYGKVEGKSSLSEIDFGVLDSMEPRSCYPESKRAAETLMKSYFLQYNVPVYIARIAHTFGPGMATQNDGRIMSDLVGNAIRKENVLLKSKGEALRAFCYVSDTIVGCLYILLKGEAGVAYNLSNEKEEISIKDLAEFIASYVGCEVKYDIQDNSGIYCNYKRIGLDTHRLEQLGWCPKNDLRNGLIKTIDYVVKEV